MNKTERMPTIDEIYNLITSDLKLQELINKFAVMDVKYKPPRKSRKNHKSLSGVIFDMFWDDVASCYFIRAIENVYGYAPLNKMHDACLIYIYEYRESKGLNV